jgi:hypothetical protein
LAVSGALVGGGSVATGEQADKTSSPSKITRKFFSMADSVENAIEDLIVFDIK